MPRFRIDQTCRSAVAVVSADATVLTRCHVANRWTSRLIGLLATPDLAIDEGLWITPCRSVHTWGMRMPIACAFVDVEGRVVRVVDPLPPWRTAAARGAAAVLETRAGGLGTIRIGDVLVLRPPAG